MTVNCLACGQANPNEARFCSTCGQPLAAQPPVGLTFVGRQGELARLGNKLAQMSAGQGALMIVVGEAGIGKTSVIQQFATLARQQGAAVLWGTCLEGEGQLPYAPWVEALRDYTAGLSPERLHQQLGFGASILSHLIPELQTWLPESPPAVPLNPVEERFRLYDAISRFLLNLAENQPVLLVLDDLHWADPDSLAACRYIARLTRRTRLLLVGLYRDSEVSRDARHPVNELLAVLQREVDYERLVLRGLTQGEVAIYLAQTGGPDLPQVLVQKIHSETNGNPFYVRQVFRHLIEEARITWRGERWVTDFSMAELGIPAGIRQVLLRQLARLSAEANTLLRYLAAFSSGVTFSLLQGLTNFSEERLLDILDEALRAGLITARPGPPPRYEFVHAIIRHTLADEPNPDRQARLHRRIAEVLQQANLGEDVGVELAFQYFASRALPGAEQGIPFCLAAAKEARVSYAHDRAVTFLRMARDLAGHAQPATRAEILSRLALAEAEALLLAEAQGSAEAALAAFLEAGAEPGVTVEFLTTMGRLLKEGGASRAVWQPLVERGIALVEPGRDIQWARLMLLLGQVEPVSTDFIYVSRWLGYDARAIALARASGDEDDYARTLEPLDWRSRTETETVLRLARTWQHPRNILRALDVTARDLLYRHGDIPQAEERLQELLVAGERFGSIPTQAEALAQLVVCQALMGNLASARQTFRQARELTARLGPMHRLRALAMTLDECFLAEYLEGEWPRLAEETARFATDPQAGQSPLGLVAAAFAALSFSRAGNISEARRFLAALTRVLEQVPPTIYLYNGALDRASTVVWQLEVMDLAPVYHRLILDLLAAGQPGSPLCSNALAVARMAALLGRLDEAVDHFMQARRATEAAGQPPLRALADYDEALALHRAGSSDRARLTALSSAALVQFQALHMIGWEERARRLMDQSAPAVTPSHYPDNLTSREVEVLRLIGGGSTNKEIAGQLTISLPTVERHIANIYRKIEARNRAEATAYALKRGLVKPPSVS